MTLTSISQGFDSPVYFIENVSSVLLRERLCSKQIVIALAALVRSSKFSILQNEGIIALTLLFTQENSDAFIQDGTIRQ